MTKSQRSATKLRLSRIVRCLLALGCLKLAIMGVALVDLPMPAWFGDKTQETAAPEQAQVREIEQTASNSELVPLPLEETPVVLPQAEVSDEPLPQGAAAAELAAAAKPRKNLPGQQPTLPAPLVTAGPAASITPEADVFVAPNLPAPAPLGAPLLQAGMSLPKAEKEVDAKADDSIWNILDLKSLPIPGLGSAQAAHAASLDMPAPNTPQSQSPFTPAEQINPLGSSTVLPGAPPLSNGIPSAFNADGSPLPPRQGMPSRPDAASVPPLPANINQAPAPNIENRPPSSLDSLSTAQELARQQQDMLMLRQQMDQRLKDLQTAEDKVKEMLKEARDVEESKVKSLVQMYANMKPRMAAQALENMDERIAVRILSGMAPKQSGEILTYTNPAKTAKFTEMITRLRLAH